MSVRSHFRNLDSDHTVRAGNTTSASLLENTGLVNDPAPPFDRIPEQITNVNIRVSSPKGRPSGMQRTLVESLRKCDLLPFVGIGTRPCSRSLFQAAVLALTIPTLGALQFGLVFGIIITSLMWAKQSAQDISANTRWVLDAALRRLPLRSSGSSPKTLRPCSPSVKNS